MATTPRGISYPTVGDAVTPLANKFAALATTTDTAIGNVANALRGLASAIPAAGVEGRTYYATDTDRSWFDTGATWISNDSGSYLIRPTAVAGTGVTIAANGAIVLTAVPAGSTIRIEGIFSSRFKNYQIRVNMPTKQSVAFGGGAMVQGLIGSAPVGGTSYSWARNGYVGGARVDAQATAQGNFGEAFVLPQGSVGSSVIDVLAPNSVEPTFINSQHLAVGGVTASLTHSAALNDGPGFSQLTGLQVGLPAGPTWTGEVRIYGMS